MNLSFNQLRRVNSARAKQWDKDNKWSIADWVVEFIGEFGEACNLLKKLKRQQDNMVGNGDVTEEQLRSKIRDELADAQICLDMLAEKAGVNLADATIFKFNLTSAKNGFSHRLSDER